MTHKGFSTYTGVFIPNVTMMFGVILFFRLGVVLGNVGILQFFLIITISLAVMVITSFSIASIVTNMHVGSGGAYYLISRSLGIEIGGACGLALVLSQLISMALCISGFAYSFQSLYPQVSIQQVEVISMTLLVLLSFVSANLALKTQSVIFYLLLASIGSIFFSVIQSTAGTVPSPTVTEIPMGFWASFALFYPALTGIEAGMALSGNLKTPSRSLVIGNLSSLLCVAGIYALVGLLLWLHYPLDVLQSHSLILLEDSKIPQLVYLGIWCATISSALGNILGAPRMLQMIAEDGIVPEVFSRVYGPYREPRYAIAFVFILGLLLVLFTTIDQIIPVLAMICLLTYGALNLVAALAELIQSPNWRPKNRCPWQLSLIGACSCLFLMLMIDVIWTIVSVSLVTGMYIFLRSRGLEAPFKDFRDNILFFFSRLALYRLSHSEEHSTNWLPQILVFIRTPSQYTQMIEVAHAMTRRSGILTVASVMPEFWNDPEQLESMKQRIHELMEERGIEGLLEVQASPNYYEGVENLIKVYGMGALQPNTVMMSASDVYHDEYDQFVSIVTAAQMNAKNLIIYFNGLEAKGSKIKTLDIWWDAEYRESFELMLSYLMALRASQLWNPKTIYLRATVPDKRAKKHLSDHFHSLFHKIRIRVKPKIEVSKSNDLYANMLKYSSEVDFIFFPLPSIAHFEEPDHFKEFFLRLHGKIPKSLPILGFTSYDQCDHKEIYL